MSHSSQALDVFLPLVRRGLTGKACLAGTSQKTCRLVVAARWLPRRSRGHLTKKRNLTPSSADEADPAFRPQPYYQVFQERLGFLPNLSIVDLLFNMGPESLLVLEACRFSNRTK